MAAVGNDSCTAPALMTPSARTVSEDTEAPDPPARDPFVRRVATVVAIITAAGLLLTLFILGIRILLAAFAGVLLAVLLRAFTDVVKRATGLSDSWALTTALVLILAVLASGGWLLAPQISEQADQLTEQLPQIAQEVEEFLQRYGWGQWVLQQGQGENGGIPDGAAEGITGFFSLLADWSTYILVAVFVGLFAAANPQLYQDGIVHLFPLRHRAGVRELLGDLGYTLRWWLIGQAIAMVLIGVSTMVVLWIFGIPLAIIIGLIVGLLGFIPYLGPIIGVIPVALISALEGADTLLYVLLAYTGVQLLEGYVATPLIQHRMVYLPPVMTIIAQILLGAVLGVMGVVLATPLAAVLLVLTKFYRRDILGDRRADEEAEEAGENE